MTGLPAAGIGYTSFMRLRLGLALGFGTGYYLGARAGRPRYDQINQMLARARGSDAYEAATEKARTVVEEGVDRARDLVEERRGTDGHEADDTFASPISSPSPGPPPAGSLSTDPPTAGGPPLA